MQSWKRKVAVAMLAITTSQAGLVSDAHACGFWNWLHGRCCCFGRNDCAPTTVGYAPACPTCVGTPQPACTTCQPCAAPCQPCAAPCQPCLTTQRICTYCPQTCYQTAYRQVPVTVYRPVTACDPCTGCPVTTLQACTTTTVQAYRVPVTTYRQVCRDVVVPAAPAAPVAAVAVPQYGVAAPACSGCGVPAAPAYVAPQPAPAYAVPQTAPTYATPAPQLGPVITPIPGPAAGPSTGLAPSQGDGSGYQGAPADTPPVLPPSQIPQSQPSYNPSSLRTDPSYPQRVPAPALRPLPDLERTNEPAAPPLLNPSPNDRTAQRTAAPAGAIVPVEWSAGRAPAAAVPRPDSSGWRPSR